MIRFENISKSFGSKQTLDNLCFEVQKGEIYFILGMSGTGKSVTLKHIVGLTRPDSGKIFVDGQEISSLKEDEFSEIRKKCALVFQKPALLDSRNIYENICLGIRQKSYKEKIKLIRKGLESTKLEHLEDIIFDRKPTSLSYGEQKRLSLARTLITSPDTLLYDEPTTGLDPQTSESIHQLIYDVAKTKNRTSLVVSHDIKNALKVADKIAILDKGKIVDLGTPEEISQSTHTLTKLFLEDLNL